MALGINLRASVTQAQTAAQTISSGSFTPAANSLLMVFVVATNEAHPTTQDWSVSGGGLSWSRVTRTAQVAYIGNAWYGGRAELWVAEVGGSPSSMSVVGDPFPGSQLAISAMIVYDVTGNVPSIVQSAQDAVDYGQQTPIRDTDAVFASPATSGNLVVGLFGQGRDDTGGFSTPTGWTALASQTAFYTNASARYRTDFTGTVVPTVAAAGVIGNLFAIAVEITESGAHEPSADGEIGLALGIAGTARKISRSSGSLSLDLAATHDTTKAGQAAGAVGADLDLTGAAEKAGQTSGDLAAEMDIDGATVKTGAVAGAVSIEVAVEAAALAAKLIDGAVGVDLDTTGTAAKHADVTAAIDLALELAGDAEKATAVAGALGLALGISGTAVRHEAGLVNGSVALALAIAATAVKHVEATGQTALVLDITGTATKTGRTSGGLGLDLGITGTARPVLPDAVTGTLDLALGITGTATKRSSVVATLDLLLAIVGHIGTDWVLDPCRTLTVPAENRTMRVDAETRVRAIERENRTLVAAC